MPQIETARGPVAICVVVLSLAQVFDIAFPIYNINELSLRQAVTPDELLRAERAGID